MADNKSFKGYQGKIAFRVVLLVFLVFGMIPLFMMAGVLAGEVADGGKRERAEAWIPANTIITTESTPLC